jgi:FAD:protein FMN transferase
VQLQGAPRSHASVSKRESKMGIAMNSKGLIGTVLDRARAWASTGVQPDSSHTAKLPSRSFRSMGTVAAVTLGGDYADRFETVAENIQAMFDRLESEMSVFRPGSAICELSRMAGVGPVAVPEDTFRVLSLGQHFGGVSGNAFSIAAAPLVGLWGFNGAPVPISPPSDASITRTLELVDCRHLVLRDGTAFLPLKGMAVDVGGIAKGYAVDRAYDYCLSEGIEDFLIDFSGNVRAAGRPSPKENWQIGVRDPFDASRMLGKIALPGGSAVATSGSYERFVDVAGKRFSHIIDPRTGYPVTETSSTTVLCADAVTADALSTAFFVAGLEGAGELLKKLPSVELLLVPDKRPMDLCLTPGFDKILTTQPSAHRSVLRCK